MGRCCPPWLPRAGGWCLPWRCCWERPSSWRGPCSSSARCTARPPPPRRPWCPRTSRGRCCWFPGTAGRVSLNRLATALRSEGKDVTVVRLPDNGLGDLRVQARTLAAAATAARARTGAASVDVVGLLRRRGRGPATGCRTSAGARRPAGWSRSARRTTAPRSPSWARCSPARARSPASSCCPPARLLGALDQEKPQAARGWSHLDHAGRRGPAARLRPSGRRAEPDGAERLPRPRRCATAACRPTRSCRASSAPQLGNRADPQHSDAPTAAGSARDVLGREVGPGRAEQHDDVDRLQGDAPLEVAPQDRVAEQVDEGEPVAGRQVRLQRPRGVDRQQQRGPDEERQRAEGRGQRASRSAWTAEQRHRRDAEHRERRCSRSRAGPARRSGRGERASRTR